MASVVTCEGVAPGRKATCGSKVTSESPETRVGRSVKWYTALKPRPKRPVVTSRSSFEA